MPGAKVIVDASGSGGNVWRIVTADAITGNWLVDFAHFTSQDNNTQLLDLQPGDNGSASESDVDGNETRVNWHVPKPSIRAVPAGDYAAVFDWPDGAVVTLTVDDPTNGAGVDQTVLATIDLASWDPTTTVAWISLAGFDLKPGHIMTVTDGTTERTYIPTHFAVTGFDLDANTISGIATPGVNVSVCVIPAGYLSRSATADAVTGFWTVNYDQLADFQPGTNGWAYETDANGNATW